MDLSSLDSVKTLLPFYTNIFNLVNSKEYSSLDKLINEIDINNLSDVLLVGIPRLMFIHRSKLHSWDKLINAVKIELQARKYNCEETLRGIL